MQYTLGSSTPVQPTNENPPVSITAFFPAQLEQKPVTAIPSFYFVLVETSQILELE